MIIRKYGIMLKRLEREDLELLRRKRNSDEVRLYMFYQKKISREEQEAWFESIHNIYNYFFLIIFKGKKVGLINGKNVDYEKKSSEGGIFIWDTAYRNSTVAARASIIMAELTFKLFRLEKTYAEVRRDNRLQIRYNEMLGYELVEEREENKSIYVLTEANYRNKGSRILKAAAQVSGDTDEIDWEDIDFSGINKSTISRVYQNLPSEIQERVDQYILT